MARPKVHINFYPCEKCNGRGILVERVLRKNPSNPTPFYEDIDVVCPVCLGTGADCRWVSISTLAELMEKNYD